MTRIFSKRMEKGCVCVIMTGISVENVRMLNTILHIIPCRSSAVEKVLKHHFFMVKFVVCLFHSVAFRVQEDFRIHCVCK